MKNQNKIDAKQEQLERLNKQLEENPGPIKKRLYEILEDQYRRRRNRMSLAKMVEHFNDRWDNIPPAVEATYDAFFENEDYWSDQPQYRWSTPYLWSEKGTA